MHFCRVHNLLKLIAIILFTETVMAQSALIPEGSPGYHILDRMEIKSGHLTDPMKFTTSARSYRRMDVAAYVDSLDVRDMNLSHQDYFNLTYLQKDNFEWRNSSPGKGMWGLRALFKEPAAMLSWSTPAFNLVVNPIFYYSAGFDTRTSRLTTINNHGVEFRGAVKGYFSFYTSYADEIQEVNSWTLDYFQKDSVIPGASGLMKTEDFKTFNYDLVSAYVNVRLGPYNDIQFGHGKNFIGNGFRSLLLSDFSSNHLFLRLNTRFWKLNYTNIWGTLTQNIYQIRTIPKRRYYAASHLSINVTKNLNIGAFQTIAYQRDSGSNTGFELEYLNPIIFYKPLENGLNSPDKAILGTDFKYNFLRHFSTYGQLVISEMVLEEVFAGKGWWGNKQAAQLGLKYIDAFGVHNLDLQGELNVARPYMYTSFDSRNAYVNRNQNMAHPLGANFREWITLVRYQPTDRVMLKFTGIFALYGNDTGSSNWGGNIRLSYGSRMKEYGNKVGQGITTRMTMLDLTASWMMAHNLFGEIQLCYRETKSELSIFNTQAFLFRAGIRWNISERRYDF